jgi:hypothetical protein
MAVDIEALPLASTAFSGRCRSVVTGLEGPVMPREGGEGSQRRDNRGPEPSEDGEGVEPVGAENAVRGAHLDFRRNELATKLDHGAVVPLPRVRPNPPVTPAHPA